MGNRHREQQAFVAAMLKDYDNIRVAMPAACMLLASASRLRCKATAGNPDNKALIDACARSR